MFVMDTLGDGSVVSWGCLYPSAPRRNGPLMQRLELAVSAEAHEPDLGTKRISLELRSGHRGSGRSDKKVEHGSAREGTGCTGLRMVFLIVSLLSLSSISLSQELACVSSTDAR